MVNVNCADISKTRFHCRNTNMGVIVALQVNAFNVMLVREVQTRFFGAAIRT